MNEELTNEVLEAMARCEASCSLCEALEICMGDRLKQFNILATDLLEERAKPKVWDKAPEWADRADVSYKGNVKGKINISIYTRELPKTRIDEIIDESLDGWLFEMRMGKSEMREILKSALTKYAEELEGKK